MRSSNVNPELNVEKCKFLRINRKQKTIEYPFKLHNIVLEDMDFERDFGVWTSSNFTRSKHAECHWTQASKMLGFIRRSLLDIRSSHPIYIPSLLPSMLRFSSLGSSISQLD